MTATRKLHHTIHLSESEVAAVWELLNNTSVDGPRESMLYNRAVPIPNTRFAVSLEVISPCNPGDEPCWAQAGLYELSAAGRGMQQIDYSEPSETILGEWEFDQLILVVEGGAAQMNLDANWENNDEIATRLHPYGPLRPQALRFRPDPANPRRQTARFRHRDNRIWTAAVEQVAVTNNQVLSSAVTLSSTGCRTYHFLAPNRDWAKQAVLRFANLSLERYGRLVADAAGCASHPVAGDVCVFKVRVFTRTPGQGDTDIVRHVETDGVGRVCNGVITMFPQQEEIRNILDAIIGNTPICLLLPRGVNAIDGCARVSDAFSDATSGFANVTEAVARNAIAAYRNDTAADVIDGHKLGIYVEGRNARQIDLGDNESNTGPDAG